MVGDVVLVDSNQRHSTRRTRVTQARGNAGLGKTHATLWAGLLGLHQFAVLGTASGTGSDGPLFVGSLVDGQDAPTLGRRTEHPDNAQRVGANSADHPGGVGVVFGLINRQAAKNAITCPQSRVAVAQHHQDARFCPFAGPFKRLGKDVTVGVRAQDFQNGDWWEFFCIPIGRAALGQLAFVLQFLQQTLQVNPGRPFDPERLRNIAFGGLGGVGRYPVKDL